MINYVPRQVWDLETQRWIPFGMNSAADFYDLINPFIDTPEYTAAEARDIVQRYRQTSHAKSYRPYANAYVIVFDLRFEVAIRESEELLAEFLTIELANLEPVYSTEEYERRWWYLPKRFYAFDFGTNVFGVENKGGVLAVEGSLLAVPLDNCIKHNVESSSLDDFCLCVCNVDNTSHGVLLGSRSALLLTTRFGGRGRQRHGGPGGLELAVPHRHSPPNVGQDVLSIAEVLTTGRLVNQNFPGLSDPPIKAGLVFLDLFL